MRTTTALAFTCAALALASCEVKSKLFCEKNPSDPRCADSGDDGGGGDSMQTKCTSNAMCTDAATPACDTANGVCVACFGDFGCDATGNAPICGSDNACHGCVAHADCIESDTCLDSGACADRSQVAYVSADPAGTASGDCSFATPCDDPVKALATNLPFVRVRGTLNTAELDVGAGSAQNVTFLGDPGTSVLTGTGSNTFVIVSGTVLIEDLTISSAAAKGIGVLVNSSATPDVTINRCTLTGNGGQALRALGGTLTLTRSSIRENAGGGITLGVSSLAPITFTVVNNFIVLNGGLTSLLAGAQMFPTSTSRFNFNTVADNEEKLSAAAGGGGVDCVGGLTLDDNIFAGNQAAGSDAEVTGDCTPGSSLVTASVAGVGFVDPTGSGDFHLTSASGSAIDHAIETDIKIDIDGQIRPQGSASDLGADEYCGSGSAACR